MLPGASEPKIKLIFDDRSGILLGGQVSGGSSVGELINTIALAIQKKITVSELDMMQIATHPLLTVAATVHPLISAVRQVPAKLRSTIKLVSDAKSMAAIIADGEGKDDQRSVRYRRLIVACTGHFITHGRRDKWLPY
jgi:hypothetical protein